MIFSNPLYVEDVTRVASSVDFSKLTGKTVVLSGATGMIGSFLADVLLSCDAGVKVVALGRSREKAEKRFKETFNHPLFTFAECNVSDNLAGLDVKADYIIHCASTTHPVAYSSDPIGTVTSNVLGAKNLLEYGVSHGLERFVFLSSVEIYGENRGDVDKFTEDYCGYIDCNTLRAGYPESKRLCEALCQAYRKQYGCEIVIARLARSFGPTMQMTDSKAIAQFIKKALSGSDIILKSQGNQLYSYSYVPDAVLGILLCLVRGEDGEAYNFACDDYDLTLRQLAGCLAELADTQVKYEIPDEVEAAGYSKATKALMDGGKACERLGWRSLHDLHDALERTITVLRDVNEDEI